MGPLKAKVSPIMDFGEERKKMGRSLWILVLGTKKKKQIEIKRKNTLVTNIRHFS